MAKKRARNLVRGGPVRGPGTATSDSILARVSNGEYVLPKPAVDLAGLANLEALRQVALAQRMPGYALGGEVNSYGNDLSLANRMNAGADSMRAMREGPATQPPTTQSPNFMTGLQSLMNPLMQAQQTYQNAQAKADPLDVASGRFDREYAPRMAQGGFIGKEQWDRLPRFQWGGYQNLVDPETQRRLQAESMQRIESGLKNLTAGPVPVYSPSYGAGATPPSVQSAARQQPAPSVPTALVRSAAPAAPTKNMMTGKRYVRPAAPTFAGQGDPLAGRLPDVSGLTGYTVPQGPAPAILPTTPGPGAGGYENRGGVYRKVAPAPGFGPANPNRVPGPGQNAGTTTYTVPGVTAMGGGPGQATFQGLPNAGGFLGYAGTPETAGMNQAEATAYNVGHLNRQIDALRSLREAQNPGITTGGSASSGPLVAVGTAGGNYGDEAMQAAQARSLIQQATAGGRTFGGKGRRSAALQAGLAMLQQQQAQPREPAQSQGINPYQAGQLQHGLADIGLRQEQAAFERQKWAAEQQRNQALDAANIARTYAQAQPRPQAPPTSQQVMGQLQDEYVRLVSTINDPRLNQKQREAGASRLQQIEALLQKFQPPAATNQAEQWLAAQTQKAQ